MKTAKIVKLENVDDSILSATLQWAPADAKIVECFDLDQLGGELLNSGSLGPGRGWVNLTECSLKVGDSITDEAGGEPILGAVRGEAENVKGKGLGTLVDYRDAYAEKTGLGRG